MVWPFKSRKSEKEEMFSLAKDLDAGATIPANKGIETDLRKMYAFIADLDTHLTKIFNFINRQNDGLIRNELQKMRKTLSRMSITMRNTIIISGNANYSKLHKSSTIRKAVIERYRSIFYDITQMKTINYNQLKSILTTFSNDMRIGKKTLVAMRG